MKLNFVMMLILLSLNSVSSTPTIANTSISPCPLNLDYVLTYPWDLSACKNKSITTTPYATTNNPCCQTLFAIFAIALSQRLKDTSLFKLPDLPTSISCLSQFQTILISLSLPSNLTSICFQPQQFVNTSNVCANIQSTQDWIAAVGPFTQIDSTCRQELSQLDYCEACVAAGFRVQSQLVFIDGNKSHATDCFYYTVLYAAGVINQLGPKSMGSVFCIFGLPVPLQTGSKRTSQSGLVYALAGVGVAILGVCGFLGLYFLWNRHKLWKNINSNEGEPRLHWRPKVGVKVFKFQELVKATENFSSENIIGRGQFGLVYKGSLPNGTMVAVKKIIESNNQGIAEFRNEVEIISSLKHRNLVLLRGCCVTYDDENYGECQRFLVYDYMPNGNLNTHLFGIGKQPLIWPKRKSIILDVANGLAYLHYGVKPAIYHRDIKPTNILLDVDMRARLADFGLVKQSREAESYLIITKVAGTHGYLAPEYALYGHLTEKSDIYSFGIVLLEIMCGRKALDFSSSGSRRGFLITDWAWALVKAGRTEEVLDASLVGYKENPRGIMGRFVLVGILCTHVIVALRPTILDALKMLEGDIEVPVIHDPPGYAADGVTFGILPTTEHKSN